MTWFGTGNKPLPEPIMIQFIAVTRPQYVVFNVLRICWQLVSYQKTINWAVSSVVGKITRFKSSCNNEMHHYYIYLILEYISCHTISLAFTPGDSIMFIQNDKMVRWLLLIFSWHILFPWLSIPVILWNWHVSFSKYFHLVLMFGSSVSIGRATENEIWNLYFRTFMMKYGII